jgi:hypothetical protein
MQFHETNSKEFVRIRDFFLGFTRKVPIRDCLFQKILSLEQNLNSCITDSCEFESIKFASSFILMINFFEINNHESGLFVRNPEKNSEFTWNRANSSQFSWIRITTLWEIMWFRANLRSSTTIVAQKYYQFFVKNNLIAKLSLNLFN